jgi:hypothetical protein
MAPKKRALSSVAAATAAKCAAKRVRLQRRSSDEQTERLIKEKIPEVTSAELNEQVVQGQTLKQRIQEARRSAKDRSGKLSTAFWRQMRTMYTISDPVSHLLIRDESEPISPGLVSALQSARNPNASARTKADIISFFHSCSKFNQREVIGIVRHVYVLKPSANQSSAELVVNFMRALARNKQRKDFEEEILSAINACMASHA